MKSCIAGRALRFLNLHDGKGRARPIGAAFSCPSVLADRAAVRWACDMIDRRPASAPGQHVAAWALGLALLLLGLALMARSMFQVPFESQFRDPAAILKAHPLTGFLSHLGVLGWWTGAAISLFAAAVLPPGANLRRMLLTGGLLTAVLALDDMFMIHDDLAYRHLHLSQRHFLAAYLAATLLWLWSHRGQILASGPATLAIGLGCFSLSLIVDIFLGAWPSPWRIFLEDGFKILGIACWSGFLVRTAWRATWDARGYAAGVNP